MSISSQQSYGIKRPRDFSEETNTKLSAKKAKVEDTNLSPIYSLLPELVVIIFSSMKAPQLRTLALTCTFFKTGSYNVPFWRLLFRQADLHGVQSSFREEFMLAVKKRQPKALLIWADFLSNQKYIEPNILRSDAILTQLINKYNEHPPRKHLQLKFDAILLRSNLQFLHEESYVSYSNSYDVLASFDRASPERKTRAKLYRTKIQFKNKIIFFRGFRSRNHIFKTFKKISTNIQAYPEDRAQALLYMAIMIFKGQIEEKPYEEAEPLFSEVIASNEASPRDRSLAKYYLARMKMDEGRFNESYNLFRDVSQDDEMLSKTKAKIFCKMGELIYNGRIRHIDKKEAADYFLNVLKEKGTDLNTQAKAQFYLARMVYFGIINDISYDEAAQMLMEIIENVDADEDADLIDNAKINLAHMRCLLFTNLISDRQAYEYYCESQDPCCKFYKGAMRYDRIDKELGNEFLEIESDAMIIKQLLDASRSEELDPESVEEAEFFAAIMWIDRRIDSIEGENKITVESAIRIARKMSRISQGKSIYRDTALLFIAKMRLLNRTNEISDDSAVEMLQDIYNNSTSLITEICLAKLFTAIMRFENRTNAIDDAMAAQLLEEVIATDDAMLKDRAEAGHYLARMAHDKRTSVLDRLGSQRILRKTLYEANRYDTYIPFRDSVEKSLRNMEKYL